MQVNIIRKPAPIDNVQIELSPEEHKILYLILYSYNKEKEDNNPISYSYSNQRPFIRELLERLYEFK